jgi:hypothetical protein
VNLLSSGIFKPNSTYQLPVIGSITLEHQSQSRMSFHSIVELPIANKI